MKIVMSAESTIDLSKELLKKYDIKIVPFTILVGDKSYLDGDITPSDIFQIVKETKKLPKTSAVNTFQYENHFNNLLSKYDAVIHLTLSSEMSSAYQNAVLAADNIKNVYIIDSRTLSTGIALLAIYGNKLIQEGLAPEEIVDKIKQRIPTNQTSFVLNRVDYLYKGGRCSYLQTLGSNILHLRPQIIVANGKMISGKKFRGNQRAVVDKYVDYTLEEFNNPDLENVFITYTTASNDIIEAVKDKLNKKGFKNIMITTAGGTISSHCGEDCIGILYLNK